MSGSDDEERDLDDSDNLDFVSRIMDSLILDLVDLYLDVGGIPEQYSNYCSGGHNRQCWSEETFREGNSTS